MKISKDRVDSRRPRPEPRGAVIRIHPEALERLRLFVEDAKYGNGEMGGFLLGAKTLSPDRKRKHTQSVITIEAFMPASSDCVCSPYFEYTEGNAAALRRQLDEYSGTRAVVGFFRSSLRAGAGVTGDDMNLVSDQFGGEGILLLIDLGSEPLSGTFYTFDPGKHPLALATRRVQFTPHDDSGRDSLGPEERSVAKDERRNLLGDVPDSMRNRARGERSPTLAPWALIGVAFTVLLILGFTQYRTLRLLEGQHLPETSSRMSTVLDLRTERAGSGSQWVVNWNQSSDVVRNSSRGRLSIRDGYVIKKEVELTKAELQSGRLFYTPLTDDVSFRLEVFDLERGKSTSEAIRVLAKVWSDGDLYGSELAAPRPQMADLSGSRTTLQDLPRKIELRQQSSARIESAATADAERSTPPALKRFTPPAYRQPVVVSRSIDDAPDVPSTAGAAFLGLRSDSQMPALGAGIPPPPAPAAAGLARAVEKSDPIPATLKSPQSPPRSSDISSFQEPKLLRRVDPKFPSGRMDLTGTVTVEATIGVDGIPHDLRLVSGSPLLGVAALQAIKEWRYSPALLNGRAIPAPTAIQVRFKPDPASGKR